jgi:septum site-determining protein MinD
MANMLDFLDLEQPVDDLTTLHDVLADFTAIEEAMYPAPGGFDVVPSGVDLDGFVTTDPSGIPSVVEQLRSAYDIVILDTGAGLSREMIHGFDAADTVLLVSSPRIASVRDAEKTIQLAHRRDAEVGIIFNKSGTGRAPPVERIANFLDTDLLGHVPEDPAVPTAQDHGRPVVVDYPDSSAAEAYREISTAVRPAATQRTRKRKRPQHGR